MQAGGGGRGQRLRGRARLRRAADRAGHRCRPALVAIVDQQVLHAAPRHQLACCPPTDRSRAYDDGPHVQAATGCIMRRPGPASGTSPEVRAGQLPPTTCLGRHAIAPPEPEEAGDDAGDAESAKGTTEGYHVGLGGIDPPTSALSVLRSNRLSYSPG